MSNKIKCSHCHLEFDSLVMIEEEIDAKVHRFCCSGCQSVYHLLKNQNLDSFYEKTKDTPLSSPTKNYIDSSKFDTKEFYEKYVKVNSEGFYEVSLIIEGIHCSACVWLNEKALGKMAGVVEANINFTNNKAHIVWADNVVKLSKIIDMIRAIGYNAFAYDAQAQEEHINKERKAYYLKMAVAIFASMNIMWIAVAQYAGYFSGISQDIKTILNIAEGILATPVLFYSGWVFFRGAYFGVKSKIVNMDLLVATGALLTYIYSIYATATQNGEAYFDSVSMIITFILIGKFLEVLSKKNASDALDAMIKDIPSEVRVLRDNKVVSMKLDDVKIGDTVIVSSGEKALLDGKIVKGSGSFDESSLSGESAAVYKSAGDTVISGTISIDADVEYEVLRDFKHSTLSNIISLLEKALKKKPKIEHLANKLSRYFSATILALALLTFFGWFYIAGSFERAFMISVSVIIIACPCALALATPVATLVGLGISAKRGILFKEAAFLETMANATTLVLDKTGTITQGKPEVVEYKIYKEFDKNLLFSLTKLSNHPISKGITKELLKNADNLQEVIFDDYKQLSAKGIKASYRGMQILGGNEQLLKEHNIEVEHKSEDSLFYFAINKEIVALFELRDKIKEGAKELVQNMKQRGVEVILLSGDHKSITQKVAKQVGIESFFYEQTPQDKAKFIESLQANGKKVVMVGDGVNDILSLATADIAISMGSGSDIAVEVGDVVLLNDSLKSLNDAFNISKTTFTLIKQNLFISLFYNAITIPLAIAGFVIPLFAAISMSLSSLLVVANSMRIKKGAKKWIVE